MGIGDWLVQAWQFLVAGAPAITALGVLFAAFTYFLRSKVDQADQWWKRVEYALELHSSENERNREIGYKILQAVVPEKYHGNLDPGEWIQVWWRNWRRWKIRDQEAEIIREILANQVVESMDSMLLSPTVTES